MPTVTETSQIGFSNIGPLTTVFTPPAACATAAPDLWLAMSDEEMTSRVRPFFKKECEPKLLDECYASGLVDGAAYSSAVSVGYPGLGVIGYFSPASACPHAHTTVGVASKGEDGKVSSSGIFVPPVVTEGSQSDLWLQNPPLNVMMEVLDKNETAIICCPQDYTVGFNGGCFSRVADSVYGEKTACNRVRDGGYTRVTATFTYNDTVVTGVVVSVVATSQAIITRTSTLTDSYISESFYAVASQPAYTLIHGGAVQETTGTSGTAAPTQTGASGANGFWMTTSGGGVGVLATVWAFAALAGVALVLPL
ncbi:uncharacterized protein CTRU02_211245 [Colletotrichum truncatum]|uniref:Uncharacterized protein n=1 Tax=Colletotrichum truncatum TaxID=5467 RepID=A0ACC3YSK1_COLTU|nr:uncharacterized protein CTRU02_02024 [Colletotrichum truncatum]KAF6799153.1 hypothetical protein CTRU02_02024 [Colletotrichum truncatum]